MNRPPRPIRPNATPSTGQQAPNPHKNHSRPKPNQNSHQNKNSNGNRSPNQSKSNSNRNGGNRSNSNNSQSQQGQQQHHRSQHNKRPLPLTSETLWVKYFELMQQHNQARKKYFEHFYRSDEKGKKKLERDFFQSIESFRQFENTIPFALKDRFKQMVKEYPYESTYCQNHQLNMEGKPESDLKIVDPHISRIQAMRPSFKDDTEESIGSIEDYKKLKGLL